MAGLQLIRHFLRTLPGRMIASVMAVNLLLGALLAIGIMHFVSRNAQSEFINYVRTDAYTIASLIAQDASPDRVSSFLNDLQLTGQIVFAEFSPGDAATTDPRFKEDFAFGQHDDNVYYLAVPVTGKDGVANGTLRLGYDESHVVENIRHIYHLGLAFTFVYLWILLLITAWRSLRLTQPLSQLQEASQQVAKGDLDRPLAAASNLPEIIGLASDLELMRQELLRRNDEISSREARYRAVLENLAEGVLILNHHCQIEAINPAAQDMFCCPASEALGMSFYKLADDETHLRGSCAELLGGQSLSFIGKRANGETFPMLLAVSSFQHGDDMLMAAVVQDISERRAFENQLTQMAYYDPLTGLPNRRLFHDRLTQSLALAERQDKLVAIFFLDLDRFKNINDTLGHEAGDALLRGVSERLSGVVRKCDTVCRMGGDEFTVLLEDIANIADAEAAAEKIIESFTRPFAVCGQELFTSTSIGITLFPFDASDVDTLIKNADTAMYQAKQKGRGNYQLYSADMNATLGERLSLESDLRKAMNGNDLRLHYQPQMLLHYQPQVEHSSGEIIGAEALLRWMHPKKGLITPDKFIPLAEESGLILPIGDWVIRTACEQNKAWQAAGLPPLNIAVNLSPRQLQHPKLVSQLGELFDKYGFDPSLLELEITESMALHHTPQLAQTLQALKNMGVRISIDDFGTGLSSLSSLQRLPVDTVKIDRSFVRNITTDQNDAAIARGVIEMASNMGIRVVAEGVETEEQMRFLLEHRCNVMQGFYFSKPVPPEDFESLITREINARNPLTTE